MDEKEKLNTQIQELMKKYKLTMWALVACIVVYLVFLFIVKAEWSTWVVLAICVVMIVLAVLNTKYSRAIQKLAKERAELIKQDQIANGEISEDGTPAQGASAIVADAKSLNDLPKEYTVLDEVDLNGKTADHVIVSPYGIAIVGTDDLKPEMEAVLGELEVAAPVFVYSPDDEIAVLAEKIQLEKEPVLDESQIMKVLYKVTGLKNS